MDNYYGSVVDIEKGKVSLSVDVVDRLVDGGRL